MNPSIRLFIYLLASLQISITLCELKNTGPKEIKALYQLMKDVHELLVKHHIAYWVDSGTLLGAVRHGGIIPWDNDLDICIAEEDEKKLLALEDEFVKLGYQRLTPYSYGYQMRQTAWLDFFITSRQKHKIWYRKKGTRMAFGIRDKTGLYITADELYPLKLYTFGDFQVYGPRDPIPYLHALYGKDCLEVGYMQLSGAPNDFEKTGTKLTQELKSPAQPTGPLEDRVR